ncbi:endolytic transglycosylase MltG [Seminibacterium arietis]|uniref:Endolytic murein transglycosylase n=1 Tax=Seminibacterium arietis TaxID=1173502 RepID=A0ABW3IB43_9PAST
MKKIIVLFLVLVIFSAAGAFWGYHHILQFTDQPIKTKNDQLLHLERGTTGKKLANLLEQQQILENATLLPWLLKFQPHLNQIKAGVYRIDQVKTVGDLLNLLNSGKEAQFSVRFIEGETFKTWRKTLQNAPHLQQTLQDKTDQEIFNLLNLAHYGKTANLWKNLDGLLYPDTYSYTANSTDLTLLKRASERMQKTLSQAWEQRNKNLPLANPYEMLILASIVEKETALDSERGKVASVFINRLNKKMRLQTDPTVIYGMGDNYQGNISRKDLNEPTPYNTYIINGLPPTPIAMPSEKSIFAVANPEKTDYLYFVADGSGGHKFSQTLSEHNRAVQDYLRWYRSQKNGK